MRTYAWMVLLGRNGIINRMLLDSGLLDLFPLSSSRHQNRVRIVYVGINLPSRARLAQEIKTAVANGQMIHLARAAGAGPDGGELVVTPECSIKHDDIRCMNCIAQFLGQFSDSGCK